MSTTKTVEDLLGMGFSWQTDKKKYLSKETKAPLVFLTIRPKNMSVFIEQVSNHNSFDDTNYIYLGEHKMDEFLKIVYALIDNTHGQEEPKNISK